MATEQSPLLAADHLRHNIPTHNVYDRFTRKQKRIILAIVSLTGFVPMFVRGCFVPSIPQISKDLDATPAAVSQGVSLAIFATFFGVMFWSGYTSFYGRRTVYLWGIPITILASFAVAASNDLTSLLLWRFVQTFGCSGGYIIGPAAIGDIYKVEERGTAMGTFIGATLAGLALAPPIGGIFAENWSWRGLQAALGMWSVIQMLLLFFFFPETAHPGSRGIDGRRGREKFWINPFSCLTFLRSPNIMAVTLANGLVLMTDFVLLIPIAYTMGAKYGITSESLLGILFLPNGLGNFVGAPIGGLMSDAVVRKAQEKRMGLWVPEDRLRAAWLGGLLLVPISITLAGFTTAYVDGKVGLVINIICLFTNGIGVDIVLTPIGAYTVDIVPSRSAEVNAAVMGLRSLLIAAFSAVCIPAVELIGVAATYTIAGMLSLVGYVLIWLTIRYGEQMRAYVDVGYPNFDDQGSDRGDNTAES